MKYNVYGVSWPERPVGERLLMLSTPEMFACGKARIYSERKKQWRQPYFEKVVNILRFRPGWKKTDHSEEIEVDAAADAKWADYRFPKGRPYP